MPAPFSTSLHLARYGLYLLGVCASTAPLAAQWSPPITIETVVVGNPNNPADAATTFGSVGYTYRIGKYEVTNAQYAAFLNTVAASDPFDLYNLSMASDARGGILRTGDVGSFAYSVKPGYANLPVVFVSFWDAARFANWLATGYTEGRVDASAPLLPGAAYDTTLSLGGRLPGAVVFLPSENEWYKAAYHHPQAAGGPSDDYWQYATRSDTAPTSRPPSPFAGSANYFNDDRIANGINGGYAVTQSPVFVSTENYLTEVGAYGPESESYYGTADQNGNVWEWNESVIGIHRGLRGGSWFSPDFDLRSSYRLANDPFSTETFNAGFRIASLAPIPEPRVYAAVVGGAALLLAWWRRRRGC